MKLTLSVLKRINEKTTRIDLAGALNVTEQTIIRLIKDNAENGALTKAAALEIIRKKTRLGDKQILVSKKRQPINA